MKLQEKLLSIAIPKYGGKSLIQFNKKKSVRVIKNVFI